jgi:hypothetical protein
LNWSSLASNTCTISAAASSTTTQFFEVKVDGTTIVGVGCAGDAVGLISSGPTGTPCAATPASGSLCVWQDTSSKNLLVKDDTGQVYAAVKTLSGATSNQWVQWINSAGVVQLAQVNFTNLAGSIAIGQIPDTTITLPTILRQTPPQPNTVYCQNCQML